MSHSNDVNDAVAAMLAMGTAGAAAAQGAPPPPPDPPQEPAEEPAEEPAQPSEPPSAPEETPATAATPQRARAPRRPKTPRATKAATPAADEAKESDKKIRFTVAMDSDLINLVSLARLAFPGGKTIAQIFFAAARRHATIAADLPDTPLIETVLDDKYDDVVTQAAHRTPYSGYVKPKAYAALAADAFAAGLESSDFVRRTVRRYLAVEHAFVPAAKADLLKQPSEPCDAIMEELKAQVNNGRPAAVLPTSGGIVWAAVELLEGTPLRALTDEAMQTMPGCTSATQALLTVL